MGLRVENADLPVSMIEAKFWSASDLQSYTYRLSSGTVGREMCRAFNALRMISLSGCW